MIICVDRETELEAHSYYIISGVKSAFTNTIIGKITNRSKDLQISEFKLCIFCKNSAKSNLNFMVA